MKRTQSLLVSMAVLSPLLMMSCATKVTVVEPVVTTHVVCSPGENFTALTKVH